jgi:hypothetical protein
LLLLFSVVSCLSAYDTRSMQYTVISTQSDDNIADKVEIMADVNPGFLLQSMVGESAGDQFGFSVADAGDVNNDDYDDVIVGTFDANRAYIFFGGTAMDNTDNVTLTGSGRFGWSVSGAGDVNNDGYDDVIVGTSGGNNAYIFFGGDPMDNIPDVTLNGAGYFGESVCGAGNVNNDDYDDVIVGATQDGPSGEGRAYIFYGAGGLSGSIDSSSANVILTGENDGDSFGFSVSKAGNVNNDDYDDVIVGAYQHIDGRAYLYYGDVSMNNNPDVTIQGGGGSFSYSVSDAGDLNDDDYDDVIVGAPAGAAYIFYGGSLPSFISESSANVTIYYEESGEELGSSVSGAGDVNDDGYDDVIVGAPRYDGGGSNIGRAYIHFGKSSMDNTPDIIYEGESDGDDFGRSVSKAGNVNGAGYDSVIIGAWRNDEGGDNAGKSYIYSNIGISEIPVKTRFAFLSGMSLYIIGGLATVVVISVIMERKRRKEQ